MRLKDVFLQPQRVRLDRVFLVAMFELTQRSTVFEPKMVWRKMLIRQPAT